MDSKPDPDHKAEEFIRAHAGAWLQVRHTIRHLRADDGPWLVSRSPFHPASRIETSYCLSHGEKHLVRRSVVARRDEEPGHVEIEPGGNFAWAPCYEHFGPGIIVLAERWEAAMPRDLHLPEWQCPKDCPDFIEATGIRLKLGA